MKFSRGFTLVELMIVILIVALLTLVAVPSYRDYVREARRSDAKVSLTKAATQQERYFMRNNAYSGDVDDIGGDGSNNFISPEGLYEIESVITGCDSGEGSCFTLTATAIETESQWDDIDCRSFSITDTGRKTAQTSTASDAADCW